MLANKISAVSLGKTTVPKDLENGSLHLLCKRNDRTEEHTHCFRLSQQLRSTAPVDLKRNTVNYRGILYENIVLLDFLSSLPPRLSHA